MNYNIYIIIKKKTNCSFFLKSFIFFLLKFKSKIFKIIDYGKLIFFKKNFYRLITIQIYCKKNILIKIKKILNIKKDLINYIILKKKILLEKFYLLKKYLSKNFMILPSLINKIKFNNYRIITKKIKILKILGIIPHCLKNYIKKINL